MPGSQEPPGGQKTTLSARYTDLLWVPVYICFIAGLAICAGFDLNSYSQTKCYLSQRKEPPDIRRLFEVYNILIIVAACLISLALSGIYYVLAYCATPQFIAVTLIIQISMSVSATMYYFTNARFLEGTTAILWIIICLLGYAALKSKIKDATAVVELSMAVSLEKPSVIFVSVLGSLIPACITVLVGAMTMANYAKHVEPNCTITLRARSQEEFIGVSVYTILASQMALEVTKATLRTTICCVYGWWLYPHTLSSYSAVKAFGLIVSCSFGSMCFGGILLACMRMASETLELATPFTNVNQSEPSVILVLWLLQHITLALCWIFAQFNNYIYVHVALFNHSYLEAASHTIRLVHVHWRKAIVNDLLAGGVLSFGAWSIGRLTSYILHLYLRYLEGHTFEGLPYVVTYVTYVGMHVASVFIIPISAGAQTIFVCMSYDEEVVREKRGETVGQIKT